MEANDISLRPAKHEIMIASDPPILYGPSASSSDSKHADGFTQRPYVLRVSSSNTIVWPGDYIEVQLPSTETPDTILALEPRSYCVNTNGPWPIPQIIDAVDGKIRFFTDSGIPQKLGKHDPFCQALPTIPMVLKNVVAEPILCEPVEKSSSNSIDMDPDNILPIDIIVQFQSSMETFLDIMEHADLLKQMSTWVPHYRRNVREEYLDRQKTSLLSYRLRLMTWKKRGFLFVQKMLKLASYT